MRLSNSTCCVNSMHSAMKTECMLKFPRHNEQFYQFLTLVKFLFDSHQTVFSQLCGLNLHHDNKHSIVLAVLISIRTEIYSFWSGIHSAPRDQRPYCGLPLHSITTAKLKVALIIDLYTNRLQSQANILCREGKQLTKPVLKS